MDTDPITGEPLPTEADVTSEGGELAGEDAVKAAQPAKAADVSGLSLEDINTMTGKDFKSLQDAKQAIGNTWSDYTKKSQELATLKREGVKGSEDRIAALEKDVHNANFYAEHPELKPYKNVIASFGQSPDEVVADKDKKEVLDKLIAHDETQKSKSVLMSNPRLGQVTDKMSEAKEALNAETPDFAKAESSAVDAVIDAYELEK